MNELQNAGLVRGEAPRRSLTRAATKAWLAHRGGALQPDLQEPTVLGSQVQLHTRVK